MKELTHDLLIRFFEEHHPEKLKYKPRVVEIIGSNVVFKMDYHDECFCTSIIHISEK